MRSTLYLVGAFFMFLSLSARAEIEEVEQKQYRLNRPTVICEATAKEVNQKLALLPSRTYSVTQLSSTHVRGNNGALYGTSDLICILVQPSAW